MTMIMLALALASGPSFAEKTKTARPDLARPPAFEGCEAEEARSMVGKTADEALANRARDASGAATVRLFRTGQPITQDLRPDRLNLEVGPDGKVVSARCF